MKINKLAFKMQFVLNILFIFVMIPLVVTVYFSLKSNTIERSTSELRNTADLINENIEFYAQGVIENHLRSIAVKAKELVAYQYNEYRTGDLSEEEAYLAAKKIILDKTFGKVGETGYLAGISSEGVLAVHPRSEGVDAGGYEFMQKAITMKDGFLEYMWKNNNETEPRKKVGYLSYFEPWDLIIWASSYTAEFIHLIDVDLLLESVGEISIGETGYPIVLASNGDIVYHPALSSGNMFVDKTGETVNKELNGLIDKIRTGSVAKIDGTYHEDIDSMERFASISYLEVMDWYVISTIPSQEVFSILVKIERIMIVFLLVAFAAMNLLISLVFRWLLKPLKEINRVASAVSQGDITNHVEIISNDEAGEIAAQVNSMTDNMRNIVQRMKKDVETLNSSIQELSSSTGEISSTSNEQAAAVKEIVSTMEDSDELTKGIAKKINEVSQISDHSRSIVNQGVNNVEESLVKMDEIKISNHDTISGIRALSEKIEAIWEIVSIINNIADQTKIIAFNAELEASAAGDAGKNFQIVASEIRRLANSTVTSTSEIKNKINEIQHSSDRLITASEDGTNKIKEGGQLTETLHQTFEEILETTEISADSAKNISMSIGQQVMAFEQILLTLKQISEGTNNFVVSTKSTALITRNLKEMSDSMKSSLSGYKTERDVEVSDDDLMI